MSAVGMTDLHVLLEGGAPGFDRAGSPLARDRPRWAVECQVRTAAGSLATAGAMGSLGKRPASGLAGAIGVDLTVSALTDSRAISRAPSALPDNGVGKRSSPPRPTKPSPEPGGEKPVIAALGFGLLIGPCRCKENTVKQSRLVGLA
jgi:hypothetical protein